MALENHGQVNPNLPKVRLPKCSTGRGELLNVDIRCGGQVLQAVIDSDAEIIVLREEIFPAVMGSSGRVLLIGAFDDSLGARLQYLPMESREVLFLCAVNDRLVVGTDLLLTPEAYDQIRTEVTRSELLE